MAKNAGKSVNELTVPFTMSTPRLKCHSKIRRLRLRVGVEGGGILLRLALAMVGDNVPLGGAIYVSVQSATRQRRRTCLLDRLGPDWNEFG